MPTICMFRGIKIYINYQDHVPSHFHADLARLQKELFPIEPLK